MLLELFLEFSKGYFQNNFHQCHWRVDLQSFSFCQTGSWSWDFLKYPKLPPRHPKCCAACPKDNKRPRPPLAAGLGTYVVHSALLRWLRYAKSPSSQTDWPGPSRPCPTTVAEAGCHVYTSHRCRMGFVTYLKFIFFLSLFGSLFITGPLWMRKSKHFRWDGEH